MRPIVGVDKLYIAEYDEVAGTFGTPVHVPKLMNIKKNPKSETEKLYADNGTAESYTKTSENDIEIEVTEMAYDLRAIFNGHKYVNGALIKNTSDQGKYLAVGYRAKKSNGKYRYYWLQKVKFEPIPEEAETEGDKIKFQTLKIKGSAIGNDAGDYEATMDEDSEQAVQSIIETWFTKVVTPEDIINYTPPVGG